MALLSGQQITASFLAPPFQYRALEKGMHKVLSSYDVMGGPASFLSVWSTSKFRTENPKAFKAVVDAFREATDLINTNRRKAAEIYVADSGGKESVEETEKQLADPDNIFDLGPKKLIKLTDFMNAAGNDQGEADLLEGDVLPGSARPHRAIELRVHARRGAGRRAAHFDRLGPSACPVPP